MLKEWFADDMEIALEFLRDHANQVLVFPDGQTIERYAQELQIVAALDADDCHERTVARMASLLNLPTRKISKVWRKHMGDGVTARRERASAV